MDTSSLQLQVDTLAEEIDNLEEVLQPLLQTALSTHASKLPLLDKAKLYTLVTYSIESILFSYLSLNGVKAKEHAVFTELMRVRQYFQKIKQVEQAPARPSQSVDAAAAARFIKAGLASNKQLDKECALHQAKERAMARLKPERLPEKRKADMEKSEATEVERKQMGTGSENLNGAAPLTEQQGVEDTVGGPKAKSSHAPLGHKRAFQALVKGPLPTREPPKKKRKSKD